MRIAVLSVQVVPRIAAAAAGTIGEPHRYFEQVISGEHLDQGARRTVLPTAGRRTGDKLDFALGAPAFVGHSHLLKSEQPCLARAAPV